MADKLTLEKVIRKAIDDWRIFNKDQLDESIATTVRKYYEDRLSIDEIEREACLSVGSPVCNPALEFDMCKKRKTVCYDTCARIAKSIHDRVKKT